MTLGELRSLVRLGENERLEFKRKVAHPEKIIKEIVAFANTKGGRLLIGVDDDGKLPGLKCVHEEQFALNEAIKNYIEPTVDYAFKIIPLNAKKSIISYEIFESNHKPHYVLNDGEFNHKKVYVRVEDRTVKASKETRQILRNRDKEAFKPFRYGKKEQLLMAYLDKNPSITVDKFQEIAKLPRFIASKTLVRLVLADVLDINVGEVVDTFQMKIH